MNAVKSVKDMQKWMNIGYKNRAVRATEMNANSSRSHSIFTIYIDS
jgi:kinesin family protein 3/17